MKTYLAKFIVGMWAVGLLGFVGFVIYLSPLFFGVLLGVCAFLWAVHHLDEGQHD